MCQKNCKNIKKNNLCTTIIINNANLHILKPDAKI